MKVNPKRRLGVLFTALAAASIAVPLGLAGTAQASSTACLNLGPGCGSEVNPADSLGWNPAGGNATLNNVVNAYPDSGGGTGTDWLRTQPVSGEYQFQYAPSGTGSGLCASDPGGGVPQDPFPDGIILRTCNTMGYQYFKIGSGNTLVDVNTGLPVKDNGQSNQLIGTSGDTTAWNWQGGSVVQPPPAVTTTAASNITSTTATLNGTVNPEGASTTYQFDWGTSTSYGSSVPVPAGSAGSGTTAVNESANLTGLAANTTYHYRIEATNSGGTTDGTDQQFTTSANGQMSPPPGFTTKVLEDQFTGTSLNTSHWNTYVGDRGIRWDDNGFLPSPYSGFNQPGASGQAMYAPSQLSVNNGLTITAQRNNSSSACGSACATYASTYPWVSGTINTEGKFTLPTTSSWYVQANIKMPDTSQGMWPAMWFLCGTTCSPENELDGWEGGFDEIHGVPANQTAHYDYFSNAGQQADEFGIGTDVSQGYHVYAVKFVPNTSITYYFDGHQEFQVTAGGGVNIPAEPYEIMLNEQVAAPGTSGYHTVPNSNTPSTSMQVAEVQAYTP